MDSGIKLTAGVARPATGRETVIAEDDNLELRVWLRLLSCANRIERSVRQELRDAFGVTLPRFDLMSQLERAPTGLTMGELSRRLMVTSGNVTGLIDRLVAEGLVQRFPVPNDRRANLVRLTEAGLVAFREMLPRHEEVIAEKFEQMRRADLKQLLTLLGCLKRNLENGDQKSHPTDEHPILEHRNPCPKPTC